ncbi:ThiF family adenylyltransferase [Streptomyces flavotricini]|uniref:ThiF family adenylyltransferase n=1 Tax=Streptomyces flavotricini TaxID=66888 RepID=A0ABS8E9Z3_9ACTN|nr:ThiF family adenylyltransferase [Streptomyces flavotricini]MCC0097539.1 ThiF family adenylyltransferase [Streptomyces flavotricini]
MKLVDGENIKLIMRNRGIAIPDSPSNRQIISQLSNGVHPQDLDVKAQGEDGEFETDSLISALHGIRALEEIDLPHDFSPLDLERNSRTIEFLSAEEGDGANRFDMQARVRNARVLLIGTGGLGSWIAYGLAAMGVGAIRLCDPDTVALSNLNRSILYDESTVGRPKAEVARDRLKAFAPRLDVECRIEYVKGPDDVARLAEACDLVINVADQPHRVIRRWVAQGALQCGVPVLEAGGGRIGPFFFPGQSSCAGCLQASQAEPGSPRDVLVEQEPAFPGRSAGSLAAYPASESGVVLLEAYRFLSGMAEPQTKNAYLAEGKSLFDGKRIELPVHPACRVCSGR